MTGGPRGPTAGPLDLEAIEARLGILDSMAPGFDIPFTPDVRALLALVRETRAALQPFGTMLAAPLDHYVRSASDELPVTWSFDPYATDRRLTLAHLRHAAAVLAQARDGPA